MVDIEGSAGFGDRLLTDYDLVDRTQLLNDEMEDLDS